MKRSRGTSNSNTRGSASSRRARRQWLLDTFGDGTTAACRLKVSPACLKTVDIVTLSVDRYPIPGCEGGRYVRGNIRPVCAPCNMHHGSLLGQARAALVRLKPTDTPNEHGE